MVVVVVVLVVDGLELIEPLVSCSKGVIVGVSLDVSVCSCDVDDADVVCGSKDGYVSVG